MGILRVLIAAVRGLPLHVPVLAGGDGPRPGVGHVAHDADGVVDEQGGDLVHIVPELTVSGGGVRFLPGGGFQFHDYQRQTVDKQNHVGPLFGVLYHRPLVGNGEVVVVGIFVVHEIDEGGAFLAVYNILHRHTVLQIVHEYHVLLQQRPALEVFQLIDRLVERVHGQGGVDPPQAGQQDVLVERGAVVPLYVGAVDVGIA